MARYRVMGDRVMPIPSYDLEVHIHMVGPEDEDETPVSDDALRHMVDRMGPRMKRRRISDEEGDAYSDTVINAEDLRFPKRRPSTDAAQAASAIRAQERRMRNWQDKTDKFWSEQSKR